MALEVHHGFLIAFNKRYYISKYSILHSVTGCFSLCKIRRPSAGKSRLERIYKEYQRTRRSAAMPFSEIVPGAFGIGRNYAR